MKKHIFYPLLLLLCALTPVLFSSCGERLDIGDMLEYQSGAPGYDVILSVGDIEYPMSIELSEMGEGVREGKAVISDGPLKDVCFEMSEGKLRMLAGELEYMIDEKDSPALYFLFEAFSLRENDFIGAVEDTDTQKLSCRFGKAREILLVLDSDTYQPLMLEADCGTQICKLSFISDGKE